jgi:hypothetical protein
MAVGFPLGVKGIGCYLPAYTVPPAKSKGIGLISAK